MDLVEHGILRAFRRRLRTGIPATVTYRLIWPDGSIGWIESSGAMIRDARNRPNRAAGLIRDITDQRRLEAEILQAAEAERQRIGRDLHDSLGQALTYVTGVTVAQGEGHRDQLTIRGQATTSDFYVDGVRDDVEYYRDLYNVEAIEVVKGPNAMIFGRGGSGGVVNRATKQADGETVRVGIERLHLEQDAGKSIHDQHPDASLVDLNRAGVALMEIVSKPDIRSAKQAQAYVTKLRAILRTLGTCDGDMEKGNLRADVNVSVRKPGDPLGTRCEIKNVNSIRFIGQAVEVEARRQIEIIEDGGQIDQETRLFDLSLIHISEPTRPY